MAEAGAAPAPGESDARRMRYSMFSVCDHYPGRERSGERYLAEILDEIERAEALGFESYWVAEHHFHEYGIVTNPALFLTAAAARTTRIRLGPAVSILTFRNPLQVAEDYALLDRLSGGRLIMGVGSGYLKHEFEGFAIDPADKRERFDGALDVILRAWAGERIVRDDPWFQSDGGCLSLLPAQRPHPPIYIAVLRREAAFHVGRQGNGLMCVPYATLDRMEDIGPLLGEHRAGLAEAANGGAPADPALVALHTYVARSDDEARAHAGAAFDLYVETRLYARRQVYDDILRSRLGLFGSVERVTEQLLELHAMGVRHVLFLVNFGGIAPERVHRAMELLAGEVIPRVEAALRRG